jgi:hypothetical protein
MTELQIGDQTIRHDREATAAAYGKIERGFAERCGCASCRNFIAQRDAAYPGSFRALLDELGIDPNKEGEAFECGPLEEGSHVYGGWFYFAGEMTAWGESVVALDDFNYFVSRNGAAGPAFDGMPYLTLEFTTHLRWVLEERHEA